MHAVAYILRLVKIKSCISRFTVYCIYGKRSYKCISALELIMHFEGNLLERTIYHVILQSVIFTNANGQGASKCIYINVHFDKSGPHHV